MHKNTRDKIIAEARTWAGTTYVLGGDLKSGIDCSHFVWEVYRKVVYRGMPYIFNSAADDLYFKRVESSKLEEGDLVVWGAQHIGIVVDPVKETFISAQTSTRVAEASYKSDYWESLQKYFLQSKW